MIIVLNKLESPRVVRIRQQRLQPVPRVRAGFPSIVQVPVCIVGPVDPGFLLIGQESRSILGVVLELVDVEVLGRGDERIPVVQHALNGTRGGTELAQRAGELRALTAGS